jgi:GH25 family lysozyme M1 (1,4-beta-N-acetylmuramidase)
MNKLRRVTILRAAAAAGGVAMALSLTPAPDGNAAVTKPAGPMVRGLDVSAFQHTGLPINWELLAKQGIRFVAVKVSEGTYYVNPYFRSDARAAAAAGLAMLPYVFANPSRAGGAATANFAVVTMGRERGRLPLVVDLENDPYKKAAECYGLRVPATIAWIARFIARVKALTGKYPVIYTTATWWQQCTESTGHFRRDQLWLAAFDGTPPAVPSPWRHWTFWQYSNDGFLRGVGQVNLDYYRPTGGLPTLHPRAHRESAERRSAKRHGSESRRRKLKRARERRN